MDIIRKELSLSEPCLLALQAKADGKRIALKVYMEEEMYRIAGVLQPVKVGKSKFIQTSLVLPEGKGKKAVKKAIKKAAKKAAPKKD